MLKKIKEVNHCDVNCDAILSSPLNGKFKKMTDRQSINTTIYNNFLYIFAQDRIVDNGHQKFTFMI